MESDATDILQQVYGFLLLCFLLMLACVASVTYANYKREQALSRVLEAIEKNCCDLEIVGEEEDTEEEEAVSGPDDDDRGDQ